MAIVGFDRVTIGQATKESDVDYGFTPIGTPVPWHKSLLARTQTPLISGTATTNTTDKLVDSGGGFSGVVNVGDIVWNDTDSVYATVTAVDSDTSLSLDWDAFPDGNEDYEIFDEPELPGNWVECNGDTLSDATSILDGLVIPDLNGDARFLRGGTTAGIEEADQFQGHYHGTDGSAMSGSLTVYTFSGGGSGGFDASFINDPITDGTNGTPRTGAETRPINMSFIWIMRVK